MKACLQINEVNISFATLLDQAATLHGVGENFKEALSFKLKSTQSLKSCNIVSKRGQHVARAVRCNTAYRLFSKPRTRSRVLKRL
jgi:hypothetical protein